MKNIKKIIISLSVITLMITMFVLAGCNYNKITIKELKVENKTEKVYYVGDEFKSEDLVVTAVYSDESTKIITDYEIDLSNINTNKPGEYEITITFENITTKYKVTYLDEKINSIELSNQKTIFVVKENFSVGDLKVTGKRNIQDDIIITDYQVDSSKVDITKEGIYEVVITYQDLTAKYNVEYKIVVDGFELKLNETKDGYIASAIEGYEYPNYVTIPSSYNDLPITSINNMANLKATYVKIPVTVTVIEEEAFMGNKDIAIVDFTGCSCVIKTGAFYGTDLYAVELGNVTRIEEDAFADSSLMTLSIPASVTEIGDNAFNTETLNEVTFISTTLPTLGTNVFGEKSTKEDYLYIYAKQQVWDKLFENATTEKEEADIVINHFGVTYGAYLPLTDEQIAYTGLYKGDAIIYQAAAEKAVVVIDDYATAIYTYSYKGLSFTDETYSAEMQVFALNSETKNAKKLTANENGEYIDGTILYEYTGTSVVYFASEEITEVINGVAMNTTEEMTNIRFIVFGDNLTTIGDYAFSFGQLFGVTFGTNLTTIGEYAFFNQSYLQEIVFKGTTAPTIGQGAFCYIGQIGLVPTPIMGAFASYGVNCKVYVPSDPSSWWGDGFISNYVAAFNESLIGLEDSLVKDENSEVIKYSSSEFSTLSTYNDLYKYENVFTFEYGTIYMTAVNNGYVYVSLNEGNYDGKGTYQGLAYAKITDIVGYTDTTSPKKIEILFKTESDEAMRSFSVYGKFNLTDKTYTFRGEEAGTYGTYPNEILELDGYGKITYYHAEKGQYTGTYTIENNTITVNDILVLTTLTFDKDNKTITNNEVVLNTLGAEAGVYFDLNHAAKIELDGTPYTLNDVRYSGNLKLTYKGTVYESGYVIDGSKLKFTLNETSKEFTYSKEKDVIVSGYFDSNYSINLNFKIVSSTGTSTYTNKTDTLVLDGYYNATLNDQTYLYMFAAGTDIVILYTDTTAVFVTLSGNTYTVNTGKEVGMYYVGNDANYRMYLAGNGILIYLDSSTKVGTYTYNEETGELIVTNWNGSENSSTTNGILKDGFGYLVYNYYGDNYIIMSKDPIEKATASLYTYEIKEDGTASSTQNSLTAYVSGTNMIISKYSSVPQIIDITSLVETAKFAVTLTNISTTPINVNIILSHIDGKLVFSVEGPYERETFTSNGTVYILEWIDNDHQFVAFYKNESYPTILISEVTWNETKTSFSFGEGLNMKSGEYSSIQINNYGTDNVEALIKVSSPMYYDGWTAPEYDYYKINIYSDTELWVANGNISGASPEVCTYTTEVKDGVTYYTFYSTAKQKTVTFIIKAGTSSSSFSVVEEK